MNAHQMTLLNPEASTCDLNAIDHGHVAGPKHERATKVHDLSCKAVRDLAFPLGVTTWKTLIDTAMQTGHTELYSDGFSVGLRKPGYKFAPIPKLPAGGVRYVKAKMLEQAIGDGHVKNLLGKNKIRAKLRNRMLELSMISSGCECAVTIAIDELKLCEALDGQTTELLSQIDKQLSPQCLKVDDHKKYALTMASELNRFSMVRK